MKVSDPGSGESRFFKKNFFKFKSGTSLVLRVLPPMGALADKGQWNKYYAVHFGYKGTDGKMFLFQSPLQKEKLTGDIIVPDKALELLQQKKEQQKKLKEALSSITPQNPKYNSVKEKLDEVDTFLSTYNLDKKNYINAIDLSGTIGALGLGYKDFNVLKELREKLRQEENIDIASVNSGIFLQFTKTGKGIDTVTSITPYLETIEEGGRKMKQYKTLQITSDLFPRLEKEAHDLGNMYPVVTAEQVEQMVSGGPAAVDIVRNMVYKKKSVNTDTKADQSDRSDDENTLNIDEMDTSSKTPAASSAQASEDDALKELADLGIEL